MQPPLPKGAVLIKHCSDVYQYVTGLKWKQNTNNTTATRTKTERGTNTKTIRTPNVSTQNG